MKLLSVNAGSSSLKFRLFEMPEEKVIMKGLFERIGFDGASYEIKMGDTKFEKKVELKDHNDAVKYLIEELNDNKIMHFIFTTFKGEGVNSHPYYTTDIEMANELAAKINSIPGIWG